jgi:hypothetical protein
MPGELRDESLGRHCATSVCEAFDWLRDRIAANESLGKFHPANVLTQIRNDPRSEGLRNSTGKAVVRHASKGNRKKAILGKGDQHGQGGPAVDVL